ncbi:hypothetical protein ANN_26308 [Periplaneta americana]|uniref:DUF4371 domain-containing protein n=1 Tax=Periplaneta americana TaxID=6978 RepID=A0ABQ8S5Z5_PERAM|nr:hypothetical protein ANN_26308 [Periplaneta americana]
MMGLCKGSNEPPGSLKAISKVKPTNWNKHDTAKSGKRTAENNRQGEKNNTEGTNVQRGNKKIQMMLKHKSSKARKSEDQWWKVRQSTGTRQLMETKQGREQDGSQIANSDDARLLKYIKLPRSGTWFGDWERLQDIIRMNNGTKQLLDSEHKKRSETEIEKSEEILSMQGRQSVDIQRGVRRKQEDGKNRNVWNAGTRAGKDTNESVRESEGIIHEKKERGREELELGEVGKELKLILGILRAEYEVLLTGNEAEHLETSTVFKGISNRIQNDLIQAVGSTVLSAIKQEIIEVPFVAVMVDETSDVANKAQFSIVLRYVHEGEIKERFLGFCDISSDKHAQAIAELIRHFLSEFGCNEKFIAQTYDGAATMAGNLNGVQALIKVTHPEALFFHCYAHNQANDILYCQEKIQETRCSIAALRDDYEGVFQETVSQVGEPPKRKISTINASIAKCLIILITTWMREGLNFSSVDLAVRSAKVLTCYGTKIVLQWLKEGKLVTNKISQLGPMDPSTNSRCGPPDILGVCVNEVATKRPRPTSQLLASRPHAEAEVDDHPTRMEVSCG